MNSKIKSSPAHYDIVINGGGIAGSMMALEFQDCGLNVALIEAQTSITANECDILSVNDVTPRVSALSVASKNSLERLNAWKFINEQRICPYRDMCVWDAQGNASVNFSSQEVEQEQLGYIVENNDVVFALQRALNESNIQLFQPRTLTQIKRENIGDSWDLALDDGQTFSAKLMIAADGAKSFVRTIQNMEIREWDYVHHAVVATVETEKPHSSIAAQRFLSSGPLAFLPIASKNKNLSSIVWSISAEKAEELCQLDDNAFKEQLGEAFEFHLGEIVAVSKRFSFPLKQCHAIDYVQDGLALVADAAHAIHPLAGQGINLGIQDVQVLAEEILRAKEKSSDWFSLQTLLRYQRRRKAHNLAAMAVVEGFSKLYMNENLLLSYIRNAGMRLFSKNKTIKTNIIKSAVGLK